MTVATTTIRNGVDTEKMFATLDLIKAQLLHEVPVPRHEPLDRGCAQPLDDQGLLRRRRRGHQPRRGVRADAGEPAILLGTDTGPNPAEGLLHALAACLTTSLVYVAAARKVELTSVESTLTGDMDVRGARRRRRAPQRLREHLGVVPRDGERTEEKLREVVERRRRARPSTTWSRTACQSPSR